MMKQVESTLTAAGTDRFETVIGLEVHIELSTQTKMFCGCPVTFGAEPNTRICPVCLGLPGALPVINAEAVRYGIRLGLALGADVRTFSKFDRKNYFYPDLPKGYQITQYEQPIVEHGELDVVTDGSCVRHVEIIRAHLEEDAGKLLHQDGEAYVDFNRAGVPLIEVVSAPDLRSPQEARAYVAELRAIAEALGISDVRMEEGSLRVDGNVSIRPVGSTEFGPRVEVKNVNSLRSLERALTFEALRQREATLAGERVEGETRGWDEVRGRTYPMRSKEAENDYRYFPEPDLRPVVLAADIIEQERSTLPELPADRRRRYEGLGLRPEDALLLASRLGPAAYADEAIAAGLGPRDVVAWVLVEGARIENEGGPAIHMGQLPAKGLSRLVERLRDGSIARTAAKELFERLVRDGGDVDRRIADEGLAVISDAGALGEAIDHAIAAQPRAVSDVLAGKDKALGALLGAVMRELGGRASATEVTAALRARLATQSGPGPANP